MYLIFLNSSGNILKYVVRNSVQFAKHCSSSLSVSIHNINYIYIHAIHAKQRWSRKQQAQGPCGMSITCDHIDINVF